GIEAPHTFIYSPGNVSDCPNGFHWIWTAFHECAVDGRDVASVCLGLVSILCFILSSIPQYYQSWKTGNMDKALSIWFLLGWLSGDSCNLIGAFLANQLPLQTYTAIYYVLADLVMLSMYIYYKYRNRPSDCEYWGRGGGLVCNFRRRSTEGLALSLFCLVILGNLTYGLSILLKNPENGQSEGDYVLHHLPWVFGSLGVMSLDIIVSFPAVNGVRHPSSFEGTPSDQPKHMASFQNLFIS
uniref:Solute carrier family 66 member 1 n=1 Tax=Leptobrachium leishanense TaxID=445787 RepID=A0A8C5WDT6_9ANUR